MGSCSRNVSLIHTSCSFLSFTTELTILASSHSAIAGNYVSDQIRLMFAQSQPRVPLTTHYLVASKQPVEAGAPAQAVLRSFTTPPTAMYRLLQEERVLGEFKESVVQVWDPQRVNGSNLANSMEYLRGSEPGRPFEMPDGWNNVFGPERYKPAEALFDDKAAFTVGYTMLATYELAANV